VHGLTVVFLVHHYKCVCLAEQQNGFENVAADPESFVTVKDECMFVTIIYICFPMIDILGIKDGSQKR